MIVSKIVPIVEDNDANLLRPGEDLDGYESDVDAQDDMSGEIAPLEDAATPTRDEDEDDESGDTVTSAFMDAIGGVVAWKREY